MSDPDPPTTLPAGQSGAEHERRPRGKRASRRALRIRAAVAGAVAFALPWVAIAVAPRPTTAAPSPAVVYVPAGSQVVVGPGHLGKGGVVVVTGKGSGPAAAPVAMTGGSHPAP